MDAGRLFGRGISFPPRVGPDGRVTWSEGETNVREAIRIILLTEQKERLRLPEFGGGLGRFLFESNTVTTRQLIRDRITKHWPSGAARIMVERSMSNRPDRPAASVATITYKLVATQARERVSLSVTLAG